MAYHPRLLGSLIADLRRIPGLDYWVSKASFLRANERLCPVIVPDILASQYSARLLVKHVYKLRLIFYVLAPGSCRHGDFSARLPPVLRNESQSGVLCSALFLNCDLE